MKQTLIKITDDHYIIVDDSEIKEKSGDWFYSFETGKIYDTLIHHTAVSCKKITHSTEPLELLSENGLSGMGFSKVRPLNVFEVKELIGEVDVEKKADDIIPILLYKKYVKTGFIGGYNQALEDNKERKYTEENLRRYHNIMCLYGNVKGEEYIQSLQPKTSWEVEIIDGKLKLK